MSDPDFVAPSTGRTLNSDVQSAVQMLLRARASGQPRYWKCNPCGTVNSYPWVSVPKTPHIEDSPEETREP